MVVLRCPTDRHRRMLSKRGSGGRARYRASRVRSTQRAQPPDPQSRLLLLFNTTRAHTPDSQAQEPLSQFGRSQVKSSQLRHLRPLPSTTAGLRSTFDRLPYGCLLFMYRLDLTMDGGVADTTRTYTGRKSAECGRRGGAVLASVLDRLLLLFNTTRAHTPRTPKHRSHYHYGRRCGRHRPLKGTLRHSPTRNQLPWKTHDKTQNTPKL